MINDADAPGNYFVTLAYSGPDGTPGFARAGVSVPYSEEYKELQANPENLRTLVDQTEGKTVDWRSRGDGVVDVAATLDDLDVFRRDPGMNPPSSFRDLWPDLLWLAVVLFLADVAIRRVAPDFARMRRAVEDGWKKLRGRGRAPGSLHGETQRPQGRGRRTNRAHPIGDPLRTADRFARSDRPDRRTVA